MSADAPPKPVRPLASGAARFVLGLYLVLGPVLLAWAIYLLWPIFVAGANGEKTLVETISIPGLEPIPMPYEGRLILLVLAVGALGSYIHSATSFVSYVGNRSLLASWVLWYWLRPFIGMALALIFYFVIRGGLLSAGATAEELSLFGIMAIAGLVGMFSKQATDKLRETFDNLFRTDTADERRDKLGRKVLVVDAMLPADQITAVTIPSGQSEADVTIDSMLRLLSHVVTRVPVLDHEGVARYVVHQSLIYKFIAQRTLALAAQQKPFDAQAETLQGLLDHEDMRRWVGLLAYVPLSATVGDARQAMDARKRCQDVLVTDDGEPDKPLRGWLTNVDIAKHAED